MGVASGRADLLTSLLTISRERFIKSIMFPCFIDDRGVNSGTGGGGGNDETGARERCQSG